MENETSTTIEPSRPATSPAAGRKVWTEPEITIHQELKEITLAVRCANSFPKCISVVVPPA